MPRFSNWLKHPTFVGNSCILERVEKFSPKWFPIVQYSPSKIIYKKTCAYVCTCNVHIYVCMWLDRDILQIPWNLVIFSICNVQVTSLQSMSSYNCTVSELQHFVTQPLLLPILRAVKLNVWITHDKKLFKMLDFQKIQSCNMCTCVTVYITTLHSHWDCRNEESCHKLESQSLS